MSVIFSNNINIKMLECEDINFIVYSVTKEEVVMKNTEGIDKCIETLRMNLDKSYNKLMITFDGYDYDSREIYEIEEIRNYVSKVFNKNNDIFYFITDFSQNNKILLACISDFKQIKERGSHIVNVQYKVDLELKDKILEGILVNVKDDTEKLNVILKKLFIK